MRSTHWINLLLLAALFLGSAWAWPRLPDRIPAHFGAGGEVTRWTEPGFLSWFGMPLLVLAMVALNYGLSVALPRRPSLFNFPGKERFLALPAERQAPVIERMQDVFHALSTMLIGLFGFIQWTVYRSALGEDPQPYMLVVLVGCFLIGPVLLAVWLPRIQREADRQVRLQREAAGTEHG